MFCPKCGNQLKEGASFCSKCGFQIKQKTESTVEESIQTTAQDNTQTSNQPTLKITNTTTQNDNINKSKKVSPIVIIVLVFVILIIGLIVAVSALSGAVKKESKKVGSVQETTAPMPTTVQAEQSFQNENDVNNILGDNVHIEGADVIQNADGSIQIGGTPAKDAVVIKEGSTSVQVEETTQAKVIETTQAPASEYIEPTTTIAALEVTPEPVAVSETQQAASVGSSDKSSEAIGQVDVSDACTIIELNEETEFLTDNAELHIMIPEIGCSTDEELADSINGIIPDAISDIVDDFQHLVPMEEQTIVSVLLNSVTVNEGKRRVNISYKGIAMYQDGSSKNVTATIVYNKDDGSYKASAQIS